MNTSKTQAVVIGIKSVEFDNNGQLVLVGQPNDFNPKGSYVMNAAQEQRLLKRCGLVSANTLKDLVAVSNGTSKLSYVASFNKAGEAWDNGKEGAARKSGTYTKDWTGFSNHEIDLGFIAKQKMADAALQFEMQARAAARGSVQSRPATVAAPVVAEEKNDEAPAV